MKVSFSLPYRPAEAPDEVFEAQFEAEVPAEFCHPSMAGNERQAVLARAREFVAALEGPLPSTAPAKGVYRTEIPAAALDTDAATVRFPASGSEGA